MAAVMMASLPPPTTTTANIFTLIALALTLALALALALPWTRKGRRGGVRAVMCLIRSRHANPWVHVLLALEYMERVVTTMSEISAV
jgi:hypothetical protein